MAQDLRKMFDENREVEDKKYSMKVGHEERFLNRLEKEISVKRQKSYPWLKIAASVAVLATAGLYFIIKDGSPVSEVPTKVVDAKSTVQTENALSLGDLSPDLKKVESYYVANINLELSRLEVSEDNKIMVDGFMDRLSDLNAEYKILNKELNQMGPNDQTINALVKNLQLRLQLLQKLKMKLNELKSSKNEHTTNII